MIVTLVSVTTLTIEKVGILAYADEVATAGWKNDDMTTMARSMDVIIFIFCFLSFC